MKRPNSHAPSALAWYILWSAMFLMAALKTVDVHPIFSGNLDFGLSALLALAAGVRILCGIESLQPRESGLAAVLLLLFCNAQLMEFAVSKRPPSPYQGDDFAAYYIAGKVLSEKPISESLYSFPRLPDGSMNLNAEAPVSSPWHTAATRYKVPFAAPYIYPPLVAILMKPLVHLSFGAAYRVWTGMTILLVLGSVLIVLRMCDVTFDGRLALLLGVGLFSYIAFLDTLYNGQIGGVILLLLTVGVWALSDDRMGLSAFCFAVATLIKLTPVLAVPLFVFHRRWKWLIAYAAGLICLLIFSGWQAGWMIQNQFWHEVLPSISNGAPGFPNLSIVAFLREVSTVSLPLIESAPRALQAHLSGIPRIVAFLAYLLVLGRCFLRRHQRALVTDVVIVGLVAIVVSPVAWRHHFTTALLPFLYLGFRVPRKLYPLLIALLIAVGTDILVFVRALLPGPYVPAVLTAIVPGLTIALAYALLAPSREMPPGPRKRSSEVRRFVDA